MEKEIDEWRGNSNFCIDVKSSHNIIIFKFYNSFRLRTSLVKIVFCAKIIFQW